MRYAIGRWTDNGQLLVTCPVCQHVQWAEFGPGVYRCGDDDCGARLTVAAQPPPNKSPEARNGL